HLKPDIRAALVFPKRHTRPGHFFGQRSAHINALTDAAGQIRQRLPARLFVLLTLAFERDIGLLRPLHEQRETEGAPICRLLIAFLSKSSPEPGPSKVRHVVHFGPGALVCLEAQRYLAVRKERYAFVCEFHIVEVIVKQFWFETETLWTDEIDIFFEE